MEMDMKSSSEPFLLRVELLRLKVVVYKDVRLTLQDTAKITHPMNFPSPYLPTYNTPNFPKLVITSESTLVNQSC